MFVPYQSRICPVFILKVALKRPFYFLKISAGLNHRVNRLRGALRPLKTRTKTRAKSGKAHTAIPMKNRILNNEAGCQTKHLADNCSITEDRCQILKLFTFVSETIVMRFIILTNTHGCTLTRTGFFSKGVAGTLPLPTTQQPLLPR
jgi:hypothetical protein